jgi:hypothetical protein
VLPTSPKFTDYIYKWLEVSLDFGITEFEFWDMTLAELERAIESKKRVKKREEQERASFDYVLADLIGRSISRIYSSSAKMPELSEAYPTLFDSEEIQEKKQVKKDELSAMRFRKFAQAYNKNKEVSNE